MQKGLALFCDDQDLSEEAVGFGVPILKCGLQTIFPGEIELFPETGEPLQRIKARYKLNLEEKISHNGTGSINNRLIYASKNVLAGIIRNWPTSRRLLTATSNLLRSTLGWTTSYEPADFYTYVSLTYTIDRIAGKVCVELSGRDSMPSNISELIVMNEQGAQFFDRYREAGGRVLSGKEIGCWDPVSAGSAEFISSTQRISFRLPQVNRARLFRGREQIDSRLAWAGFGYTFSPELPVFSYDITLERLP
jgi:hypothetical protein